MTLNEALLLGRLKRMARSGFLSQTVQSLLFWMQINALVFQKPEELGSSQLKLTAGELPQIFNKEISIE